MAKLLRKINQSKWRKGEQGRISADALTNCLKTTDNTLSVWRADDEGLGLKNALIAMAGSFGSIETVDYVILDEQEVLSAGISIAASPGETFAKSHATLHRDLSGLHYEEMGIVAKQILQAITSEKCVRLTKSEVIQIYNDALKSGDMNDQEIPSDILKKIGYKPSEKPA